MAMEGPENLLCMSFHHIGKIDFRLLSLKNFASNDSGKGVYQIVFLRYFVALHYLGNDAKMTYQNSLVFSSEACHDDIFCFMVIESFFSSFANIFFPLMARGILQNWLSCEVSTS